LKQSRDDVDPKVNSLLVQAIRTKHLIRFRYKDQERVAEPHDYGIQNGTVRLFCYQVSGQSSTRLPGWRLVNVLEMCDCEVLAKRFSGNRETASSRHHRWDELFARVEPPSH